MAQTLQRMVVPADVDNVQPGGLTFVHEFALDQQLTPGMQVQVDDGSGKLTPATVEDRDDAGFWYLRLEK
ncbi:hypothetical protein ABT095_32210 [Kitasatospora sp. NPDC002227]|uniref:hypothetical protein n=1 Tax=Kitasatospora sp. NPDC002227 TaxID=3154773 RepID=UPI003323BA31